MYCRLNNKLVDEQDATVSINDRGFKFGDAVFTTARIKGGKILDFAAHEKRLREALAMSQIKADISDLETSALELIKKNQLQDGLVRISISRGTQSQGYLPLTSASPTIVIQTEPLRALPSQIKLGISSFHKPVNFPPLLHKTAQGMLYTLVKIESAANGFYDSIMLTDDGLVSQTSCANLFWVKDGEIYTPSENCAIVKGTTRARMLKMFEIKEVEAKLDEVLAADEIFITNCAVSILPVDEVDGRKYKKDFSLRLREVAEESFGSI